MQNDQIVIYKTENGKTVIDVKNKSTISRHLNNIYKEEELAREATVAKNATVQIEANRHVGFRFHLKSKNKSLISNCFLL